MSAEVTGAALTKVADGLAKELFQSARGLAAKSMGKLQAEFGVGFEKYIQRNRQKCRFVKTLLHRIDPIPIEQAYVEPSLRIAKEVILGTSFPEKLNELKNVVIVGGGGSGKSMFLKKLFLELCDYPLGRIPLFIELRDLNARDDKDVFNLIYHQWGELIPSFKVEALEAGFRSGKFFLLLDGLDEVDRHEREKVSKKIVALSYKFPLCPIVLTSRPVDDFSAWHEFYSAEIQPFDLPRISALVEKTSIDHVVKSKFMSEVEDRLFHSHQTFLANPLLCTMMVLTFTEFEEIPSKMHIFYSRAFDVLFTRHDKTKTFFNRKFYTSLAEDDFKRLFSTFCLFSYLEGAYSFDKGAALNFIGLASEFEGVDIDASSFLSDMHESISILVKDGDTYSFLHRSFQEYFSAVFLADRQLPAMDRLFEKILENSTGESVLTLLFEMNRDALESKFLISKVHALRKELEGLSLKKQLPQILSMVIGTLKAEGSDSESLMWTAGSTYHLFHLLSICYGSKYWFGRSNIVPLIQSGELRAWIDLVGGVKRAPGGYVDVRSIPHAKLAASSIGERLAGLRAEIVDLDKSLRKTDREKGSFVKSLLERS